MATDDVTNYVTHGLFNTHLQHACAYFKLKPTKNLNGF